MEKGKLFLVNIQKFREIDDNDSLRIFGVRFAKFLPDGWVHRTGMTPNKNLLFQIKDLEKKGSWNKEAFDNFYRPSFLKGIKDNPLCKNEILEIAEHLNNGKDVYYACYCKNYDLCHRSLVGTIFERNGYSIIDY